MLLLKLHVLDYNLVPDVDFNDCGVLMFLAHTHDFVGINYGQYLHCNVSLGVLKLKSFSSSLHVLNLSPIELEI